MFVLSFFLSHLTVMHSRYRIVHSLKSLDQTSSTGSTHLTATSEVKFKKYTTSVATYG